MVIQESTPHFRIVSLQIRLNLYVCVSWLTAQTIWLDINLPLRWRWFTYVLLRLISVHLLIVYYLLISSILSQDGVLGFWGDRKSVV